MSCGGKTVSPGAERRLRVFRRRAKSNGMRTLERASLCSLTLALLFPFSSFPNRRANHDASDDIDGENEDDYSFDR